jgi:hypothetical protein
MSPDGSQAAAMPDGQLPAGLFALLILLPKLCRQKTLVAAKIPPASMTTVTLFALLSTVLLQSLRTTIKADFLPITHIPS